MTEEKWKDIVGMIKDKFPILSENAQELDEDEGPGTIEEIQFTGPLGKMRLTWTSRPRVLDKQTFGSKRIGGDVNVTYVYSDTEKVHKFKAYRWNASDNDWQEIDASSFGA